jgi:hypothetical protein
VTNTSSVRGLVERLLAEAAGPDEHSVRVVYSLGTLDFDSTNTQYMKLTKHDVEQLRIVLVQLSGE